MALTWTLNIKWDGVAWTNEASRFLSLDTLRRGRLGVLKIGEDGLGIQRASQAGILRITLQNSDDRFDPWNASSPLYPDVAPKVDLQLKVDYGFGAKNVFTGRITDIRPKHRGPEKLVVIEAQDYWRELIDTRTRSGAVKAPYVLSVAVLDILNAASYPGGGAFDTSTDVMPYFWMDDRAASAQLHDLIASNFGLGFVGTDGVFNFRDRVKLMQDTATTVDAAKFLDTIRLLMPWEMLIQEAQVEFAPLVQQATGVIWELEDTPAIGAGASLTFAVEYKSGSEKIPADNVVTPVATTDYLINTQDDGGGTDLTASATVVFTDKGTGASYKITNGASQTGYITKLQVRGDALTSPQTTAMTASISNNGRFLRLQLPWVQEALVAQDFADWLISWLGTPLAVPYDVRLRGQWALQFDTELGDLLDIDFSPLGLDDKFRLGQIEHSSGDTLQDITTRWTLEPTDNELYWIFPTRIGETSKFAY